MNSLDNFCGIPGNGSFEVWNSTVNNFGTCFEYLALVCPPHALLLLISAYYAGKLSWMVAREIESHIWMKVRIYISCIIALESLIELLCSLLLQSYHPPILILANSLTAVAWIFNGFALWKIRYRFLIKKCLPTALLVVTLIVLLSTIIHLYSVISAILTHMSYHAISSYGTILRSILVLIYLASLISYRVYGIGYRNLSPYINEPTIQSQDEGEDDRLLRSISQTTYYSSIQCVSKDLGVAEDPYNALSKLCFWWVRHLMIKGYKGIIQGEEDLFMLPKSLRTTHIQKVFLKEFYLRKSEHSRLDSQATTKTSCSDFEESSNADVKFSGENDDVFSDGEITQRSLLSALHHSFGWQYYSLGILKLLSDGLGFAGPLLLHALVSYMENKKEPTVHGYYYATGLFLSTLLCAFLNAHFSYWVNKVGLKMRAAIITTVYQKALAISSVSLTKFSTGQVVNFMSTDTDRVVNFCPSFHQFWSLPFQVAVSLYLLHQQVGLAFLAGLAFAIVVIPINRWLAIKIQALSKEMMEKKDGRVKMMNEILYGIRVIKFHAWERNFERKINEIRSEELKSLKGRKYLDAWCVYFWATTPVIISILTFTTYALMGNKLTAAKVFTSVALFNMLISPLNAFPWVLNGLMEAWVSVQRLQAFLGVEDLDLMAYYSDGTKEDMRQTDIKIVDGQFTWRNKENDKEDENVESSIDCPSTSDSVGRLFNINITLRKGQLIGVIGAVGSGKSSLLAAITAEMDKTGGKIYVSSLANGFGLAAQEPWIQHSTVKENILFGQPFDVEKYSAIIEACALEEDLLMLPAGDETEVGENGVTLSGGQKARVALARTVYQDKDVYLLDDPLAAVDAHVAAHLFQRCILGLLRRKTVILCTHHTKYLQAADHVIVMQHGRITHQGEPSDILSKETLMSQISRGLKDSDDESDLESDDEEKLEKNVEEDSGLVTDEEKDEGAVKLHVYGSYWLAIGHCLATSILLSLLLMQASRNLSDWWLAYWISHSKTRNDHNVTVVSRGLTISSDYLSSNYTLSGIHIVKNTVTFYLIVYAGLAASNTVFTLFRAFLFAYGGVKAARVLHQRLLTTILAAPLSFFDATPIGRIVNRFSSDMYSIDDSLPFILNIFLAQAYGVAGTIAITCYGLPWFAVLLVPLALIYYYIQNYYRRTSRELKRLMSVTLSPIYAHFSETLTGLSTIRALRETRRFQATNMNKLEVNQKANFCAMAASQWLSLRLQFLGVAMVTGVAFIAVLEHHFGTVDPGLVGLAISYALSVTDRLSGMVTSFTETEKQMVSVERAVQYIEDIPSEHSGNAKISPHWPSIGQITFQNVVLIYRRGLPPALRNVSFQVTAGEKVGIVGRTGSGKSSLFLVLFRMVNIQEGVVVVDGVAVATLPLEDFRSRLAIIPQDPFLFSGSVRSNIDPWSQYSDDDLWTILQRCHMNIAVRDLGGLDADVGERGRNFSVGQRQLICLARALLSRAKILCIDEATASVDMETDELIQQTIRDEFSNSTVLTIAHRIETILDNDRVLVMDRGTVAEFDRPAVLLANRNSLFFALVYGN